MSAPEPDESTTPCANCSHPLSEHLLGTSRSDPCDLCFCSNFTTADSCPTCLDLRYVVDDRQAEHPCPDCRS